MGTPATSLIRALPAAVLALLFFGGQAQAAPSVLFAVDADRGTLAPVSPKRGVYDLTLRGVSSPALYFQNRPGDEQGLVRVPVMFRRLFQGGQPHPNAVINVVTGGGRQALMGVKLSPPRYDAGRHILRVRVTRLVQGAGASRAGGRTDVVLPRRFGDTAMFIDDCCGTGSAVVSVLNPTAAQQTVQVNNGPEFLVAEAASYGGWVPSSATNGPSYSASDPSPNVLGPGTNVVSATLSGGGRTNYFVTVPADVAFVTVQLYLFTTSSGGTWVLANNGTIVASGTGSSMSS